MSSVTRPRKDDTDYLSRESPSESEQIATRLIHQTFGTWRALHESNSIFDYLREPFMGRRLEAGFYAAVLALNDADAGKEWQARIRDVRRFVQLQPNVRQAGTLASIAENSSWICRPTVEKLDMATTFVQAFNARRPLSAARSPLSLMEAWEMIRDFPRYSETDPKGPSAQELFRRHWAAPLIEGTLVLGHYRQFDPQGYAAMAASPVPDPLFAQLNRILSGEGNRIIPRWELLRPAPQPGD